MTRPPRKPTRASPLAAAKPIVFVLVAAFLALTLLTAAIRFAADQTADPSGAPWQVAFANRSGADIERVAMFAVPKTRGAYAIAEESASDVRDGLGDSVEFTVHRACDLRVELRIDGTVHVFHRVVPIGPRQPSFAVLDITPGPRVNGRSPDEVREP